MTMLISQACKYGIRAVLYLAQHDPGPLLSRDIAKALTIPEHFLAKILQDLSKAKLLHSSKGRGGGFRLARPARDIKLLEIVQAIDGQHFGEECVLGLPACSGTSPCALHSRWAFIKRDILQMMTAQSIEGLAHERLSCTAEKVPG